MLHCATGATYEGQWDMDLKHGIGVFVFEDGSVFSGHFDQDQPVLTEGQAFGPSNPGVTLRIQDLLAESRDAEVI